MGAPTITRRTRLIVGGADWAVDLTNDYLGLSISDTLNTAGAPSEGRYWNEQDIGSYDRSLSVDTIYYGDATKAMELRKDGIVLATAGSAEWDGGPTSWLGLPSQAPIDAQMTHNVNFISREPWASGTVVVPFEFRPGLVSVDLPTFNNGSVVYLAVTSKTVAGSRTLTLGDGTNDISIPVATASVRSLDVSGLVNSIADGTLSSSALTANQTISGVFVAGAPVTLADGRN